MPYLGIFGLEFWKAIFIFEISTLVKNESLTHTENFGIGSAFYKAPESAFSEDLGTGPGPLHKACQSWDILWELECCQFKTLWELHQDLISPWSSFCLSNKNSNKTTSTLDDWACPFNNIPKVSCGT